MRTCETRVGKTARAVLVAFALTGAGAAAMAQAGARMAAATVAASNCDALKSLSLPNATVVSVELVPSGRFTPPSSTASFDALPEFCRVVAASMPVSASRIGIEIWLPSKTWNGRYQQVGTHGTGGPIYWGEMAPQLRRGFATGATDMGHAVPPNTTGPRGSAWGIGQPDKVVDYGWRAVHETAIQAKSLISAYYGRKQDYAYFNGCSKGGQDGLKSAQMFPGDFNGVIAGGAAAYATRADTAQLVQTLNLRRAGIQGERGAAILKLAQGAAVASCDADDGVVDGLVSNPSRCAWDPATLVCTPGQDAALCVTPVQAAALKENVSTVVDPVTGKAFFPGLSRGSEHDLLRYRANSAITAYGLSLYQIALNDAAWDASTFDLHRDAHILEDKMSAIDAIDPNLAPYKSAGGKIIQWHAWEDSQFDPLWTTQYYEQVASRLGGVENVQDFYRLFMIPAQGHCAWDGAGPANVGAEDQLAVSNDAEHDVVTALESWVEKGVAPRQLIATRFKNKTAAQGIEMQRPICPYPLEAIYKGSGDTNAAASFYCGQAAASAP